MPLQYGEQYELYNPLRYTLTCLLYYPTVISTKICAVLSTVIYTPMFIIKIQVCFQKAYLFIFDERIERYSRLSYQADYNIDS